MSRTLCGSFLLFATKINNLQQPVACCAVLRSPSHQLSLSLSPVPFLSLSPSHALYSLHFFRSLPPPFFCLPKDNNYCSCFFIIIFFLFLLLSPFSFRALHFALFHFFWVGFFFCAFSSSANFRFCCAAENALGHKHTHSDTLSGTLLVTHPPTDNHPDEEENHLFSQTPRIDFQLRPVQLRFPFLSFSLFIYYLL